LGIRVKARYSTPETTASSTANASARTKAKAVLWLKALIG
jgi:hypothetical protein